MELQNGIYRGKALGAVLTPTSTGKESVGIEFEFLDLQGIRFTYFGTFTEKAMEHTLKALRTAGWTGLDLSDLSSVGGPNAPEVDLVVENEEWEGKVRPKIRWVNPRGSLGMMTPLAADAAKAFAACMRGAVIAFDQKNGQRKAPNGRGGALAPEPPPHTDSDQPPF